ncbi:selenoprotein S isoform X3 [Gouania willdenowi]|uniref:selenoprotein S isoform X3 n=1 Tax=Gouania willdenowi TaxID=441366 RepID=UPI00105575E0|nr:selenoprotein S isoform X3 [Gouania willdenowi]
MDDVVIEDVFDEDSPFVVEKVPPTNQDVSYFSQMGEFLSLYGWHLLVATIVLYLLILHLKKKRSSNPRDAGSASETPNADAGFVARRQEAMEAARRKMQEELDAKAVIYREKQKQKEEEKRQQKMEHYKGIVPSLDMEQSASSSSAGKPKADRKPLRTTDYSPLSGPGGGSCSFRPGRRGPSSGG